MTGSRGALPDLCAPPFSPHCVLAAVPEAKVWEEEFDLNSVRLCFQASFTLPTGEVFQLSPVVSQPIYDNSECASCYCGATLIFHFQRTEPLVFVPLCRTLFFERETTS